MLGVAVPAVAVLGGLAVAQFHAFDARAVTGSLAVPPLHAGQSGERGAARSAELGATAEAAAASALSAAAPVRSSPAKPAEAARHAPAARRSPATVRHAPHPARKVATARGAAACTGTGSADAGFLPANYVTIVDFLTAHGYTRMGAAGIAGNIYQESKGDPESIGTGGGGLIGWTPLPVGYVTGNPAADLQTQLTALLGYNQQWAQYIPMLNAATSPVQAADVFMDYFERPGIPAAYNRESAAEAVAQACGFG